MSKALSKIIFIVFFSLLIANCSLLIKTVKADDAIPGGGKIPCDDTKNPEFNSDRPYQASPCGDSPKALFCGNELVITEGVSRPKTSNMVAPGTVIPVSIPVNKTYTISLKDMQLPILGNTEKIKNSHNPTAELDEATRMNEYLSSYLNGTNNQAEDDGPDINKVVDFSGPIQKLLPQAIQEAQRIKTITSIISPTTYTDEVTGKEVKEMSNHNQIVVCAQNGKPTNCYKGDNTPAKGTVYRLNDWKGDLSLFNTILKWTGVEVWTEKTPPLPWQFERDIMYQKAYNEWRGKQCVILPGIEKLVCIDVPFVTSNEWADLFPYIPLSNRTDKAAKVPVPSGKAEIKPSGKTEISSVKDSLILSEPNIYFAHTQENADLSEFLNKTFVPQEGTDNKVPSDSTEDNNSTCRIVNVRSNDGDNLFPEVKPDEYRFSVSFTFTGLVCGKVKEEPNCHFVGEEKICSGIKRSQTCDGEVSITLPTITKTPYADEIWKTTTAGNSSAFRKLFPKVEEGAPVSCIADIPAVTNATYTLTTAGSGESKTGNLVVVAPDGSRSNGSSAHLYFPHLGSVYDYFLKGIQTALRPQGYGEPIVGGICQNKLACGELPTKTKVTGTCNLGSVSSRVGDIPQSLKDIVSAAAQTYKVPPNLILGVLYGEGVFNKPPFQRYDWTEENVKNWATCENLPQCSGPANSLVSFAGTWETLSRAIAPDLQKLDPNRKVPNPCNLLDVTYAIAKDLHTNAGGSPALTGKSCYGIKMTSTNPQSCTWTSDQYETAIRVWEFGTQYGNTSNGYLTCATKAGSCATGGGVNAQCDLGEDRCEKNGSGGTSHNACVYDVAHGK